MVRILIVSILYPLDRVDVPSNSLAPRDWTSSTLGVATAALHQYTIKSTSEDIPGFLF
jgi:hypothetical protein